MSEPAALSLEALAVDPARAADDIATSLRETVLLRLRRRGAVLGLSGGVDSSVAAALCVRALGRERVLGLLMPEAESEPESVALGRLVAERLGIDAVVEDLSPILDGAGCYRRRDEAIRSVLPAFGAGWRVKLVLPAVLGGDRFRLFSVVAESPDGERFTARLTASAYRQVVAATSFKQRARKMLEYYHADRLGYAVVGTPNRLEYDQGFFVKNGDGAADVKPIAHLYKTQVYRLAEYLCVPEEVRSRPPTTDTYSLPQSQEEFYFSLPLETLDLCLYALNAGLPAEPVAEGTGLAVEDVRRVFRDIELKRRATAYLHLRPQLVRPVSGVCVEP